MCGGGGAGRIQKPFDLMPFYHFKKGINRKLLMGFVCWFVVEQYSGLNPGLYSGITPCGNRGTRKKSGSFAGLNLCR